MVHHMQHHIHGLSSISLRSREDTPKRVRSARPATLSCNVNTDLRRARERLCSYEAEIYSQKLFRALYTSRAVEGTSSLATKLLARPAHRTAPVIACDTLRLAMLLVAREQAVCL